MSKNLCVVDIGGTHFRVGLCIDGELAADSVAKTCTPNFREYPEQDLQGLKGLLIEQTADAYLRLAEKHDLRSLGISFAGPVTSSGIVKQSAVIFGRLLDEEFDFATALALYLRPRLCSAPLPEIREVNDITASAWRYCGSGWDPFCVITVSTGIGNKIVSRGRVLIDDLGVAGEIGHCPTALEGFDIPCSCGTGSNHIGMVSSGTGVEYFTKRLALEGARFQSKFLHSEVGAAVSYDPGKLNNALVAEYADGGDAYCCAVLDFCTLPLARAIRLIRLAMHVEKFILIGGFLQNCRYYLHSLVSNLLVDGVYGMTEPMIRDMVVRGESDDNHALVGLGKMLTQDT